MYGKLFTQMYHGTLATKGPWQALVTFQQLIILADKHGQVDMTADAISRLTTVPLEIIQMGIAALELPDPESRSPDLEGRRIARLSDARSWGWQIVNYLHYRSIRSQEERREYMRKYQRDYRAKKKTVNQKVNVVSNVNQSSKQYAVCNKEEPKAPAAPDLLVSEELWNQFKETRRKLRAPLTLPAETLLCRKLQTLKDIGHDPVKVVEQSIERGWKGFFAIDGGNGVGVSVGAPSVATNAAAYQRPAALETPERGEMPASVREQLARFHK